MTERVVEPVVRHPQRGRARLHHRGRRRSGHATLLPRGPAHHKNTRIRGSGELNGIST
jgi:hypothetical protein